MRSRLGEVSDGVEARLPSPNCFAAKQRIERSVRFYRDVVCREVIAQYYPPRLAFFRLGETPWLLEHSAAERPSATYSTLKAGGLKFDYAPHLMFWGETGTFGPMGGEEWRAFCKDCDGNALAPASRIAAPAPASARRLLNMSVTRRS
jgi:hypothetical protein